MLGQKTWAALMFQSNSKRTSSGRTQSPPTVYVRDRAASLPPDGLTHYFETSPTLINKPPAKKHLSVFEALMQPDYIDEVNKLNNLKRL